MQANKTSDVHTSEDTDFEIVSVSSSEGETPVKRSHSYDEALNLENSSDFCNGQLANIAKDLNSSTGIQDSKLQQQGDFQEKGIMDSMEIVDLPSGESMKHGLGEEGESGNTTNEKTDNLEKLPNNRMDTTNDKTGTGNVEYCTPKMDISQGGEIGISNETSSALSETSNTDLHSSENVEKPHTTPSQNEGAEDEVRDSGTLSTENTVYKPTWSQDGGREQQVIDALKTLDVRKRKSPDRDIPEVGKKPHLSENQSDVDDNGNRQDSNEEGIEDDDQTTDDEDEDDNDKDGDEGENNDDENTNHNRSKKSKKGTGHKKKKGKLKYQKKKGQLADKPTDNKEEETKAGSLKKAQKKNTETQNTTSDVSEIPHKQDKNEDNEKFKSQANTGCIDLKKSTEKIQQQSSSNDGRASKETMTAQLKNVENNLGSVQNLDKSDPQRRNTEKEVCTKTCYLG